MYSLFGSSQRMPWVNSGISINGRQSKVGRPTNMPHSGPLVDDLFSEANKYNRIYVANVHQNLSSEDLRLVFEAFGPIEFCYLQPDVTRPGKHRGFGFIEYRDPRPALESIGAMNLFDLGGQLLRVAKAITPPNLVLPGSMISSSMPAAAAVAAASITAQVHTLEVEQVAKDEEVGTKLNVTKEKKNKFSETKVAMDKDLPPVLIIPDCSVLRAQQNDKGKFVARAHFVFIIW